MLASNCGVNVVLIVVTVALVLSGRNPKTRLSVVKVLVLTGKVDAFTLGSVAAALRQCAGALRELGGHGSVLRDPVGKGVFAVLDDAATR